MEIPSLIRSPAAAVRLSCQDQISSPVTIMQRLCKHGIYLHVRNQQGLRNGIWKQQSPNRRVRRRL